MISSEDNTDLNTNSCPTCGGKYHNKSNKQRKMSPEVTYALSTNRMLITDKAFTELLCFPWLTDKNDVFKGTIIFSTKIDKKAWVQLQLFDSTTSSVLGRSQIIEESGVHQFTFKIPQQASQLSIMFRKIDGEGEDPQVWGVLLNYKSKL